ncbi:MAG: hypothetical protein ACLU8F_02350 [Clostridia bacterium]
MEYAKDEIFSIEYDEKEDTIRIKRKRRFLDIIRQNKFIVSIVLLGVVLSIVDSILISNFVKLLSTL